MEKRDKTISDFTNENEIVKAIRKKAKQANPDLEVCVCCSFGGQE